MEQSVIHVVIGLRPGGLERLVVDMTNARNRMDCGSTKICCLDQAGALAGRVDEKAVLCLKAQRSRLPWDRVAVRRLGAACIEQRAESIAKKFRAQSESGAPPHAPCSMPSALVLHAHNMAAWQYAVLAARGTGAKVVYTQHGANPHVRGMRNRIRARWLMRHTDRIVAVSKATAESMKEILGIPSEKIIVVNNGVEMNRDICSEETTAARKAELKLPPDAFVVGSVGRFSEEKNYPLLVSAFGKLHDNNPDARLLLVGDGADRPRIEEAIKECGLKEECILPGYNSDSDPLLEAMDVFCLSSNSEGMSVSLLEAGRCGKAAVVTDAGANAEVVRHGVDGFVLPAGNCDEFALALREMAANPGKRKEMGASLRERVEKNYSFDRMMQRYDTIYSQV